MAYLFSNFMEGLLYELGEKHLILLLEQSNWAKTEYSKFTSLVDVVELVMCSDRDMVVM